jgi:DNA adenine methylase
MHTSLSSREYDVSESMHLSDEARAVRPQAGAAPYQGGKRLLAKTIVQRIERIPHRCYAEPCVGMGGVFFRRRIAAPKEVINDQSRDVATFFRVLQRHYIAFIDMMRWQLTTRSEFERLARTDPSTLTDLERAARFYYLQRTAFGGKIMGRTFGVSPSRAAAFDITRLATSLEQLHSRLAGVDIECLHFAEFIRRYDRPYTLFYIDPPYYGNETDYGADLFTRDDFTVMADLLRGLQGRFILSLNDHPAVREIFAGFVIEAVQTTYTVCGPARAKKGGEVLITAPEAP